MIVAELLVLVALVIGGPVTLVHIFSSVQERRELNAKQGAEMHSDLRVALKSDDFRKLDDFLVMWGTRIDVETKRHIDAKRDSLFIDYADNVHDRHHTPEMSKEFVSEGDSHAHQKDSPTPAPLSRR